MASSPCTRAKPLPRTCHSISPTQDLEGHVLSWSGIPTTFRTLLVSAERLSNLVTLFHPALVRPTRRQTACTIREHSDFHRWRPGRQRQHDSAMRAVEFCVGPRSTTLTSPSLK